MSFCFSLPLLSESLASKRRQAGRQASRQHYGGWMGDWGKDTHFTVVTFAHNEKKHMRVWKF